MNMKNQVIKSFTLDLDTAMFKKHFHNRLTGTGMKFNIEWKVNKSLPVHGKGKQMLYIKPIPGSSLPEAAVARYHGYLLGRILPQIMFGIVLVFITALAFRLSYRSIRNQIVLNSLRNEFVSNITHELKTPVATLRVALESLGKYNMRDEPLVMEEYLKMASIETKRLEDLINRVLDHSLLDEHNQPLDLVTTDINKLISEVVDTMQQRLETRGRIEFRRAEENIRVQCDPLYLKGVLINLVDNSIKYCNKEPVIIIESCRREAYVVIEVKDNGPGIPVEYQKKVFEKFFRIPSDNIHNVKGYGLGLSFASQVMKLHKGNIEVRNLDHGCSFTLKLPAI